MQANHLPFAQSPSVPTIHASPWRRVSRGAWKRPGSLRLSGTILVFRNSARSLLAGAFRREVY
jgi:hypothetical protein